MSYSTASILDEMSFRRNRFRRNVMDTITKSLSSEWKKSGFLGSRLMYTNVEVFLNISQNGEIKVETSNIHVSVHGSLVL